MQRNIMKLSQLTNSKVLKQNTHTHIQALLKMLNAKNTKQGSDHDVTMGKYSWL